MTTNDTARLTPEVLDRLESLLAEQTYSGYPEAERAKHGLDIRGDEWMWSGGGSDDIARIWPDSWVTSEPIARVPQMADAELIVEAINALPALIAAARQFIPASEPQVITDPRYGEVYCDGGRTCECPPPGGDDA